MLPIKCNHISHYTENCDKITLIRLKQAHALCLKLKGVNWMTQTKMPAKEDSVDRKRWSWQKTLLIVLVALLLVVIGELLWVNHYVYRSLPKVEGTIELPELNDEVVVTTDQH